MRGERGSGRRERKSEQKAIETESSEDRQRWPVTGERRTAVRLSPWAVTTHGGRKSRSRKDENNNINN